GAGLMKSVGQYFALVRDRGAAAREQAHPHVTRAQEASEHGQKARTQPSPAPSSTSRKIRIQRFNTDLVEPPYGRPLEPGLPHFEGGKIDRDKVLQGDRFFAAGLASL